MTDISTVAGTVMEFEPLDGSTVSWSPPDPPNGMIIYYNIRITHSESGELEQFIGVFSETSIDVSDYVDSNGYFSVQVHVYHVCTENTIVVLWKQCAIQIIMSTCSSVVRCKQ